MEGVLQGLKKLSTSIFLECLAIRPWTRCFWMFWMFEEMLFCCVIVSTGPGRTVDALLHPSFSVLAVIDVCGGTLPIQVKIILKKIKKILMSVSIKSSSLLFHPQVIK